MQIAIFIYFFKMKVTNLCINQYAKKYWSLNLEIPTTLKIIFASFFYV